MSSSVDQLQWPTLLFVGSYTLLLLVLLCVSQISGNVLEFSQILLPEYPGNVPDMSQRVSEHVPQPFEIANQSVTFVARCCTVQVGAARLTIRVVILGASLFHLAHASL